MSEEARSTRVSPGTGEARLPGTLGLAMNYAKYAIFEAFREPIAVIGVIAFPALVLCFFVLPIPEVRERHENASAAIFSMIVFAFMTNSLFSFALDIAQRRARAWGPYLRSLPARPAASITGLVLSTLAFSTIAAILVLIVGLLFTQARPQPLDVAAAFALVILTAIPSALIGLIIGTLCGEKAAMGIAQLVMFTMAFASGLFMPPYIFPEWLELLTRILPVRAARELVIAILLGDTVPVWALPVLLFWTIVLAFAAAFFVRRDEGRRFR